MADEVVDDAVLVDEVRELDQGLAVAAGGARRDAGERDHRLSAGVVAHQQEIVGRRPWCPAPTRELAAVTHWPTSTSMNSSSSPCGSGSWSGSNGASNAAGGVESRNVS